MDDDGVRERHGVAATSGYVDAREGSTHVTVKLWDGEGAHSAYGTGLTPADARYLASQLNRLADRIDVRNGIVPVQRTARGIGRAGGRARANSLSPARRSEIARAAANKRWENR